MNQADKCGTCGAYPHPLYPALRKKDEELTDAARKLSAARAQISTMLDTLKRAGDLAEQSTSTLRIQTRLLADATKHIAELNHRCEVQSTKIRELEQTIETIQTETINANKAL